MGEEWGGVSPPSRPSVMGSVVSTPAESEAEPRLKTKTICTLTRYIRVFAVANPFVCRLSVCNVRAPYLGG